MKKERFTNIFLMLLSIIFIFFFPEFNLRLIDYKIPENSISFTTKNSTNVLENPVYILSNNSNIIYELSPNCENCIYHINSLGMRDIEYPFENVDDTIRIIMIGDSVLLILFALFVPDEIYYIYL